MKMAINYRDGEGVFQSDTRSLEMRICAAELGNAKAHGLIGYHYDNGIAVEEDKSKALAYYEVSAKKGSVRGHELLAFYYQKEGNIQTSIEHLKIAASAGYQQSMDCVFAAYKDNSISKEDLAQTLRAYQTSSNETKSKDRDKVRAMMDQYFANQDRG